MNKKYFLFIFLLLLVCFLFIYKFHFSKKFSYHIQTKIKEDNYSVQSITTIRTNSKSLNKKLESFMDGEVSFFEELTKPNTSLYLSERNELNVDLKVNTLEHDYYNIVMTTSITGPNFHHPYYKINSFTWNHDKKEFLTLESFLKNRDEFSTLQSKTFENFKQECDTCLSKEDFYKIFSFNFSDFEITEDGLLLYFNPTYFSDDYYDSISLLIEHDNPYLSIPKLTRYTSKNEVSPFKKAYVIDPEKPVVALTFDDGPSEYTEEIVKILEEYQVNATFFVLGNKVTTYQDVLRKSILNGNEIGNHSYNHKWLSRLSIDEFKNQIEKTQQILKQTLNYEPIYLRPTYGSSNNRIKNNTDLKIVFWSVDTKDWKIHNVDRIIERATTNVKDGDIILMHDIFERSKESLKEIIPRLLREGFQFVTISELEEVKKIRLYNENYKLSTSD